MKEVKSVAFLTIVENATLVSTVSISHFFVPNLV
jgi:hypothetical protein